MLGESHSLVHEFPAYKVLIEQLCCRDQAFADDVALYNELDSKIRHLELKSSPIGDDLMRDYKYNRAVLKDSLYRRLVAIEP